MAADVLAYRADEVPVGEDQRQHLELMRDIADPLQRALRRAARRARGADPEVGARIMDLQDPTSKMSTTSGSEEGTSTCSTSRPQIERKLKRAVTDSGSGVGARPTSPASPT
jgi:tryptophanyl-tRNA synthetase